MKRFYQGIIISAAVVVPVTVGSTAQKVML